MRVTVRSFLLLLLLCMCWLSLGSANSFEENSDVESHAGTKTVKPTFKPSRLPSARPTRNPSAAPSTKPTVYPTNPTAKPTAPPSAGPTIEPTPLPSAPPTLVPTANPTITPTAKPTAIPTCTPTAIPSSQPSSRPSSQPSSQPSLQPSAQPSTLLDWVHMKWDASPSYKATSGFGFAIVTYPGAAVYWGKVTKADYPKPGQLATYAKTAVATGVAQIIATRTAFVALLKNGRMVAWGAQDITRRYNATNTGDPIDVHHARAIVANDAAFAGITTRGLISTFGAPGHGDDINSIPQWQAIASDPTNIIRSVTATAGSFATVAMAGQVFTWGDKMLGGGVITDSQNGQLSHVKEIFATRTAFAALKDGGAVVAWGDRFGGGDASAVASQLSSGVEHIVSSQSAFVAIKTGGGLVVWGHPEYGGDASAVLNQLQSDVIFIAQTAVAFAALKYDGTVVTWGGASRGGDSSAVRSRLVGIRAVYGNRFAFAAVNTAGGVVTWGDAENGGTIPADLTTKSLSSGVTEVFSTHRAFAALKGATTGELVLWGNAYHGAHAGDAAPYLTHGVRTVCSNDVAFTALLTDGRAAVWGHTTSIPFPGLLHDAPSFVDSHTCA